MGEKGTGARMEAFHSSLIHSFGYYVPDTPPDTRGAAGKIPGLLAVVDLTFSGGRQTRNEASVSQRILT